nr:hypothetical protein [Angustibacter aerolatus]
MPTLLRTVGAALTAGALTLAAASGAAAAPDASPPGHAATARSEPSQPATGLDRAAPDALVGTVTDASTSTSVAPSPRSAAATRLASRWRTFRGGRMKLGTAKGLPAVYIHFTWSRTWAIQKSIEHSGGKARAVAATACAFVPTTPAAAACVLAVQWKLDSLEKAARSGTRHRRCVAVRAPLGAGAAQPGAVPVLHRPVRQVIPRHRATVTVVTCHAGSRVVPSAPPLT